MLHLINVLITRAHADYRRRRSRVGVRTASGSLACLPRRVASVVEKSVVLPETTPLRAPRGERPCAAMGLSAATQPHFQAREAEQRAMVRGAEERLREYRRLLPGGDRAGADGRFWDAVVLTAANDRQAETYVQQLDALHARGQLPGARERYLVISDPPGPRVGSGGATLHVMLRLQALVGSGWSAKKLFLLHAGGYSERSPRTARWARHSDSSLSTPRVLASPRPCWRRSSCRSRSSHRACRAESSSAAPTSPCSSARSRGSARPPSRAPSRAYWRSRTPPPWRWAPATVSSSATANSWTRACAAPSPAPTPATPPSRAGGACKNPPSRRCAAPAPRFPGRDSRGTRRAARASGS